MKEPPSFMCSFVIGTVVSYCSGSHERYQLPGNVRLKAEHLHLLAIMLVSYCSGSNEGH